MMPGAMRAAAAGQPAAVEMSDLARAIEAQGRHVRCVPLDAFFGPGGKQIGAIAFRVAVKSDEDAAIVAAHRHAAEEAKTAGAGEQAARSDIDLLGDAKTIEALYRVCMAAERDGDGWRLKTKAKPDGSGGHITYSAFPTPGWMRRSLTTDQIAYLMNLYLEVRAEASPAGRGALDDDRLDALVEACATHAGNDLPEMMLANVSRVQLTHAFVMVCERLVESRKAVEALLAEREASVNAPTDPTPFVVIGDDAPEDPDPTP